MMTKSRTMLAFLSLAVLMEAYALIQQRRKISKLEESLKHEKRKREADRKGRILAEKSLNKDKQNSNAKKGHVVKAIGKIESPFPDRRGTPRQPMLVPAAHARIRFDKSIIQNAHFAELAEFSHIFVVFVFHENTNIAKEGGGGRAPPAKIAPPRLGGRRVGCLSTRSPHRPNPIGLSVCQVLCVGEDFIDISSVDFVDGTPVLDVKPYIPYDLVPFEESLPMALMADGTRLQQRPLTVPSWIVDADIPMRNVNLTPAAADSLRDFVRRKEMKFCEDEVHALHLIEQVLRQDIRGVKQGRIEGQNDSSSSPSIYECNLDSLSLEFETTINEVLVTKISLHRDT